MQKTINVIALTIAIIGAINWGLIGFFNFNLVSYLFGSASMLSKVIYALVGICGLYLIGFYQFPGFFHSSAIFLREFNGCAISGNCNEIVQCDRSA